MVLSSGTAAYRSAIHASIGELEGVHYVRDCFPWPVRDDDDQEGDNNDSHAGRGLYERAIAYLNQDASSAYIMDSIVIIGGGPISSSRVIQTNLASKGVVDTTSTSRRSLSIYYVPPIEQWNDEHRTCITTPEDQVVPLPQGVETVASVLYDYLYDYCAPKEILLSLMNHLYISQMVLKGSIIPDNMERNVDLLKSDLQRLQEDTDQEQEELEEHVVLHHDHDGEHINNAC